MADEDVLSSLDSAEITATDLTESLDSYTSIDFSDVSSNSEGVPPADHDVCAVSSDGTLASYESAISRDAYAIISIASKFEALDKNLAVGLFSDTEVYG